METNNVTSNIQSGTLAVAPQNVVAMGGVTLADIPVIVLNNARRKSNNGKTIVTNKGKVSLLTACIAQVRSQMGLPETIVETVIKSDGSKEDVEIKTRIPAEYVDAIKTSINTLLETEAQSILNDAANIGAKVTIRRNYLAVKFDEDSGKFGVDLKSQLTTAKDQAMNSANYRFGIVMAIEQGKKNVTRLEQDGSKMKDGEQQIRLLAKAKRKLLKAQAILAKLDDKTE